MAEKLTDQRVRTAKPRATPYSISDTKEAGLELRVRPNGRRIFALRRSVEGSDVRITIGEYGAEPPLLTLEAARVKARELKARVDSEGDFRLSERAAKEAAKQARAYTVSHLVDDWLADITPRVRASTLAGYTQILHRNVRPKFGDRALEDVSRSDVREHIKAIASGGAPVVANKTLQLIGLLYKFARSDLERDVVNPAADMRAPHREKPRERVLSDEELRVLWQGLSDPRLPGEPLTVLALKLATYTAQRIGEVIGMRDSELDFGERIWTVPAYRTKSGRVNVVPLTPRIIALICAARALRPPNASLVFPSSRKRGEPMDRRAVTRAMTNVTRAIDRARRQEHETAGAASDTYASLLVNATVHDLRRTARTLLSRERLGIRPDIAERTLSHLTGAAVERVYDRHTYLSEKRIALERLGVEIDRIVSGRNIDEPYPDNVIAMNY